MKPILLDCTLRDGGYYNSWDFPKEMIEKYLLAMHSIHVDFIELGFRSLSKSGFRGGCAYTTEEFISGLDIPPGLKIGVMINANELINHNGSLEARLSKFFGKAAESNVSLVRVASHVGEFEKALPASKWLKEQGYTVGFNLMQISNCDEPQIVELGRMASQYPLDVLYFADSLGSMYPADVTSTILALREEWPGPLGMHTHDNMGQALANSLASLDAGVQWLDGTVTGMGRGAGNARTEALVLELENLRGQKINLAPLLEVIKQYFEPLKAQYGWGFNPYYHLAGRFGIHPSYVQEMLMDKRYGEEEILSVIFQLGASGEKNFKLSTLSAARHFFKGESRGSWDPSEAMSNREVLILGSGPSVTNHSQALESFIRRREPYVIALNAQPSLSEDLIDIRAACHPLRLITDCDAHMRLPTPLAIPASMLPEEIKSKFAGKDVMDFGIGVREEGFVFEKNYALLPAPLVMAYALAITTSGRAQSIFLAGFDGYGGDDLRHKEAENIFQLYQKSEGAVPLISITPTAYDIDCSSVYAIDR